MNRTTGFALEAGAHFLPLNEPETDPLVIRLLLGLPITVAEELETAEDDGVPEEVIGAKVAARLAGMEGLAGKNASCDGFDLLLVLEDLVASLEEGESLLLLVACCAPLDPDFFLPLGEEDVLALVSAGLAAPGEAAVSGEDFLWEVVGAPAVGADEPIFIFKPKMGDVGSVPGSVPSLMIIVPP